MGGSNGRFKHESLQDAKTIKSLLTSLAKGFSKKGLTLGDAGSEIVLKPDGLMNVRIKAERDQGTNKVSLTISWSDPAGPTQDHGAPRVDTD